MKKISIGFCFISLFTASSLFAEVNVPGETAQLTYGRKGVVELHGSMSVNGTSSDISNTRFSMSPGFNYFLADNIYMGAGLHVSAGRYLHTKRFYMFVLSEYQETSVDLGLRVPVGFVFRIRDHVYFDLEAPELEFTLSDLDYFQFSPNLVTAFKFPFDNAVIDFGVRHSFFHVASGISGLYYKFQVFLGFSICFDAVAGKSTP
ncbi:MAG: hypothetical protein QUS13_00630 [Smithella sp.]|nr:hypothetical protein [Smithella sp.]